MKPAQKKNYEIVLESVAKMVEDHRFVLFDRVSLLCKVYNDPEFQEDAKQSGKTSASLLEQYVSDTACNFTELYHLWRMFPKKNQWGKLGLIEMKRRFVVSIETKKKGNKTPPRTRTVITHAQYEELLQENKILKERCRHLEKELQLAQDHIETLRGVKKPRLAKHAS